jgi:hypothetical protein
MSLPHPSHRFLEFYHRLRRQFRHAEVIRMVFLYLTKYFKTLNVRSVLLSDYGGLLDKRDDVLHTETFLRPIPDVAPTLPPHYLAAAT